MSVTPQIDDESRFDRRALVRFALAVAVLGACELVAPCMASADTTNAATAVPPDDVMQADRDVAALAQDTDVREAFERYIGDDAVLFRPLPEPARQWLENHEPASGQLDWSPAGALVACDRTLAVTIGTWHYTPSDARTAQAGQYLTVWRHDEGQGWRIVLDEAVTLDATTLAARLRDATRATCPEGGLHTGKLAEAEAVLNVTVRVAEASASPFAASHVRTITGPGGGSDVAITYGLVPDPGADPKAADDDSIRAVYVRVWQRSGETWRLLIDTVSPIPR